MLSGDIELIPGPPRYPCGVCSRAVAKTHRAVLCDICEVWQHIKCVNITPSEYINLNASDDSWICPSCTDTTTIFQFSDSFFETMKPTTDINNSVHTPVHSTDCDNYRNINDSYVPSPDPEEDWGKTQPQYQESDAELNSTFSDLSVTGTNSEDENRFDVFSDLRKLKNENKKRPIIGYLNINSVRYKFDELKEILTDKIVDLLIISETKIDSSFNDNLFKVEGYKMERRDRTTHGGGLTTFVRSDLPFKRRKDLECQEIETICYELSMAKCKWCIVGAYRKPSLENKVFENDITKSLDQIFLKFDHVICLGDLNYDLSRNDKSQPLINICDTFNLDNIVKQPTCFMKNQTPSLIDVILTNSKTLLCNTANFNCGLSDCHHMIATS